MKLTLDRAGRTTRDYEGPTVAPRVQAALDAAMQNVEEDIDIDVGTLNSSQAVRGMRCVAFTNFEEDFFLDAPSFSTFCSCETRKINSFFEILSLSPFFSFLLLFIFHIFLIISDPVKRRRAAAVLTRKIVATP